MGVELVAEKYSMSEADLKECINDTLQHLMYAQMKLSRVPLGKTAPGLQSAYNHMLDAGRLLEGRQRGLVYKEDK